MSMAVLAWLLVPLGVMVVAIVWVNLAHRSRGPGTTDDSVAAYRQYLEALGRPVEPTQRRRR